MAKTLFKSIQEGHDSIGRIVFVCKDANGLFVYKPGSGFRSKHYADTADGDQDLEACFERQVSCGHTHAFYEEHERPAEGEEYPLPVEEKPPVTGAVASANFWRLLGGN